MNDDELEKLLGREGVMAIKFARLICLLRKVVRKLEE